MDDLDPALDTPMEVCPRCGLETPDYDGLGPPCCIRCGWCSSTSLGGDGHGGWLCDGCGWPDPLPRRVLTVRQPWADLLLAGVKRVENRTRAFPSTLPTPVRIWIHAGVGIVTTAGATGARLAELTEAWRLWDELVDAGTIPTAGADDAPQPVVRAVLGTLTITGDHHADDCTDAGGCNCGTGGMHAGHEPWCGEQEPCDRFARPDYHHWTVDTPARLAVPRPMRGRLGLWPVTRRDLT